MLGFSWDPVQNDYKLILAQPTYSSSAFVYSCKTDRWSKIFVPKLTSAISGDFFWFPSAIVKGISYWKSSVTSCKILKFEARNNQLTYLDTSRVLGTYSLVNLNDCLARINYSQDGSGPMDVHTFDEESSLWSKIYTFNTERTNFQNFSTCFKSGALIIAFDGKYHLYDFKSNEFKRFGCYNGTEGFALRGFSYTPTLVVLVGMKPLHL